MISRPTHAESEQRGILRDLARDLRNLAEQVIRQKSLDPRQKNALLLLLCELGTTLWAFDGEGK